MNGRTRVRLKTVIGDFRDLMSSLGIYAYIRDRSRSSAEFACDPFPGPIT